MVEKIKVWPGPVAHKSLFYLHVLPVFPAPPDGVLHASRLI